jgi:hypothetical protein
LTIGDKGGRFSQTLKEQSMYVVDTHCHAGTSWFEPVEMLLYGMNQSDVQHAILTQHRGMVDNSYLLEAIERFPGRFSAIVGVDASAPDALTTVPLTRQRLTGDMEEGLRGRVGH